MCGFVGYVGKYKNNDKIIKKMTDKIIHRGPDSDGYFISDKVNLGFRRLSIIDLNKSGSQPMYNKDKSLVIVFNGEIYNYQNLKKDLIKKGYKFKSKSDTEVLLYGYEEYKEDILNKLRGMFAFVIYDIKNDMLFGARDFYGIKPFYYYQDDKTFMFGSEIKAFLEHPDFKKELNESKLNEYLSFQYSPGTTTFFKNVYKLLPGHYFKYKGGLLDIKEYYSFNFETDHTKNEAMFEKELEELLYDSIEHHKISDVEVGSFLSSGVDSSFISSASKVNKTFTVGFDVDGYNEIEYAKELSDKLKVENISKKITSKEYFKEFNKVQYYMDEPLADPSALNLYFLSKLVKPHLKVILSGEGADEIFSGYNIYQEPLTLPFYYDIPLFVRKALGSIASLFGERRGANFFIRRSKDLEDRFIGNAFIFNESEKKRILKNYDSEYKFTNITKPYYKKVENKDDITKMQYIDMNFWLIGDILLKADKMSMASSIEVRVPFLDKVLIDYARTIPTKYRIDEKTTKKMFRRISSKILDGKVSSKKKLGFPTPIRVWLKEEQFIKEIEDTFKKGDKFFNVSEIMKLLNDHINNKKDNSRKIWTIYTYLVWYKEYFN